jgi:L-fuconolactonase
MTQGVDRGAWRARTVEAAIEPDLPIIDAHHHLWPEAPTPHMEAYPFEALIAEKTGCGHNIRQTLFVEAMARYRQDGPEALKPVGETEFADSLGEAADRKGGAAAGAFAAIVAFADMMLGDAVEEVLQAHRQASPKRLRGVRYLVAYDPDYMPLGTRPGMLQEAPFRAAFARLAPNGLSFDAWVMHPQLGELADLAAAFPDTRIVLDHVGAPMQIGRFAGDPEAAFQDWLQGLRRVAANPNVSVKLGGLNMDQTGLGAPLDAPAPWSSETLAQVQRRHLLTALELFGVDRCMFESNFPVDRIVVGPTVLWNAFKRLVADFSPEEKARLFVGTAAETYRLNPQA